MYKPLFLFLIFSFFSLGYGYSQNDDYHTKFLNLFSEKQITTKQVNSGSLLGFYQHYISSQDHGECPFYPSCSVYAISAVKKYGIPAGMIKAADRLSRCNRTQEYLYELNNDHKMIDLP